METQTAVSEFNPKTLSPAEVANILRTLAEQAERGSGAEEDVLSFRANVRVELRDEHGNLKQSDEFHNLICTIGKQQILKASAAKYLNQFAYIAIGSGVTAAAIGDTTLGTELARSTVITPTNPDANTLQFQFTFANGTGTGTVTEFGLFDAASVGNILSHLVSGTYTKGANDTLTVTYQIT